MLSYKKHNTPQYSTTDFMSLYFYLLLHDKLLWHRLAFEALAAV